VREPLFNSNLNDKIINNYKFYYFYKKNYEEVFFAILIVLTISINNYAQNIDTTDTIKKIMSLYSQQ